MPRAKQDPGELVLKQVASHIGDCVTLLTNLLEQDESMKEHHKQMAARILAKLELLEEKDFLDVERQRELLKTCKAELRFHLSHVSIGHFTHKAHDKVNRRERKGGSQSEPISPDII